MIDLQGLMAENQENLFPHTSTEINYVVLKFGNESSQTPLQPVVLHGQGSIMPCIPQVVDVMRKANVLVAPAKTVVARGTLKNALSPYKLGGAGGRSDFDPKSLLG